MTVNQDSPAAPLFVPEFRVLWIAGLAVNLGLWTQTVGASWLMLSLAPSPLMVSLIQTAQSLPMFLLGLPGGVLADLVDRRRLILTSYGAMACAALVTALTTWSGHMSAGLLLLVTAAVGSAFALQIPATHTSLAESVPRPQLPAALALSAVSFNVARAVGPAMAGVLVAITGTVTVFALGAALTGFAFVALLNWRHRATPSALPPERVLVGLRSALQYARHSPVMQAQTLRTLAFVGAASGTWALLPVIAQEQLGLDADGYGLLLGCLGAGAVGGALFAVRLRGRFAINHVAIFSAAAYAAAVALLSAPIALAVACGALVIAGAGWAIVGNVNLTALQTSIPPWVRSRAMAVYLLAFNLAMALGGALWGAVATLYGVQAALLASAVTMIASIVLMRALPARIGGVEESTPSPVAELPTIDPAADADDGPIAVQVNYLIRPEDRLEFLGVMSDLGRARKRDGALFWRVYRDLGEPRRYSERFIVRSWTDYLRQRARATEADCRVEGRARELHMGSAAPDMQHLLAERMDRD